MMKLEWGGDEKFHREKISFYWTVVYSITLSLHFYKCINSEVLSWSQLNQVGLKRENEYIPIFQYILSFKDSSSYLEIGKSMQKIKL